MSEELDDDLFEASVKGLSEDDALEAKRRYYAQKVSGTGGEVDDNDDTIYTPLREQKIDEFGRSYGTGKRKTSVARVWIKEIGRAHV